MKHLYQYSVRAAGSDSYFGEPRFFDDLIKKDNKITSKKQYERLRLKLISKHLPQECVDRVELTIVSLNYLGEVDD